jgi:hypothetical protein
MMHNLLVIWLEFFMRFDAAFPQLKVGRQKCTLSHSRGGTENVDMDTKTIFTHDFQLTPI